jgi:phospholipid/cholesterol/gamma-HCH transport system permease protein
MDQGYSQLSLARRGLAPVVGFLSFVGDSGLLVCRYAGRLIGGPYEVRELVQQMAFVGAASVPIVAVTSAFSGAVLSLYSSLLLVQFGVGSLTGGAVGLAMTRELAPVLAGIMVAARCGSAMAAQIGSMKVTEQIDALRALAVSPIGYLVVPRVTACLLMLPVLCLLGMYAGVIGGLVVGEAMGVPAASFMRTLTDFVEPSDITGGLIKSLAFGLIVSIVSCREGLATEGGAVGVGRATTSAVVTSMVLIYIINYFLAAWLFTGGG